MKIFVERQIKKNSETRFEKIIGGGDELNFYIKCKMMENKIRMSSSFNWNKKELSVRGPTAVTGLNQILTKEVWLKR